MLQRDTDLYADALADLTVAPVPSIDAVAEVEALGAMLARRQTVSKCRLDLSVPLERQARLLALVRGKVGRWEGGKVGRWEGGKVGRWEGGEVSP